MSLSDILEIEKQRRRNLRIVFDTIYDRVKIRIRNHVSAGAKYCVYTIPNFIPGYPLIKVDIMMKILISKLTDEKFIVQQLDYQNILIYWDPEEVRKLEKTLLVTGSKYNYDNDDLIRSLIR
jgi:hypothetical protein